MPITVKFKKLHQDAVIPKYAHEGDAGMDLYCIEDVIVRSGEVTLVLYVG